MLCFCQRKIGSGSRFQLRRLRKPKNPAILEGNLNGKNGGCNGKRWCGTAAAAPVGAADRKKLPEYGPLGTGCPAIERAVAALYKGQNEESFWALMNAINYALELDTRVLVPLEAASDQPDGQLRGRSILSRRRKRKTCSPGLCAPRRAGVTCRCSLP